MKTVMLFGTFDIFHAGHLSLLQQSRQLGDRVVVVAARDVNVEKVKACRPIHSEKERLKLLQHLTLVDEAVLGDIKDVYKIIRKMKPDVIALGYDQEAFVDKLKIKLIEFGLNTKIVRLKPYRTATHKSTKIKQQLLKTL